MDPVMSTKYKCGCGSRLFDVTEKLGPGVVSDCDAHEHWAREGYKQHAYPPRPRRMSERMRIECAFCGCAQVVQYVAALFPAKVSTTFEVGMYAGKTPAEVFASGQEGRQYVESCRAGGNIAHRNLVERFFNGNTTGDVGVRGTGPGVSERGGEASGCGGSAGSVGDNRAEAGGSLGLAEEATSAGWRLLGRMESDAGGDRGSLR